MFIYSIFIFIILNKKGDLGLKIKYLLLILLAFVILNSVSASAITYSGIAWNATYDSSTADTALSVATDRLDNVVVTGTSNNSYFTIKYDSSGAHVWNQTYASGGLNTARGVATDSLNNALVTGHNAVGAYYTIKYNASNGAQLWAKQNTAGDLAYGVAVDSNDDVLVTGAGNNDYLTYKYNGVNGAEIWNATYDNGGIDNARHVAVDSSDNVIVTGYGDNISVGSTTVDFFTIKYDTNGNHVWNSSYDSGQNDYAYGVDVDSLDNVIVAGYNGTFGVAMDYTVIKYDSSGNHIWNRTMHRATFDIAQSVAVNQFDDIIVTGYSGTIGAYDYFTVFYDKDGNNFLNLTFSAGDDLATGVAVDTKSSVIVTGFSDNVTGSGNDDYFTIKYNFNPSCGQTVVGDLTLAQNLTCNGTALYMNASDITLDCADYNIAGNGSGDGIKINDVNNTAIQNCIIHDFRNDVSIDPAYNNTIANNTFQNATNCILINQSNSTLVINNSLWNCSYGVRVQAGHENDIIENTINLTGEGVLIENNSILNLVHNNTILNATLFGTNYGVHIKRSHNNTVSNNTISYGLAGFFIGIYIDRENTLLAENNTVKHNLLGNGGFIFGEGTGYTLIEFNEVYYSDGMGIWVAQTNHVVRNNTIANCSTDGIELSGGYNNVSGNIIFNNTRQGIYIDGGGNVNNSVFENRIYNNTGNGIFVDNADDHDVFNNTMFNNQGHGITIQGAGGPGSYNMILTNSIYNNSKAGIYIYDMNTEFLIGNNITSNLWGGILLENISTGNNNITGNIVRNHTYSINLTNADNNTIYDNYFDDEPYADSASTGNNWNILKALGLTIINTPYLGGNFWRTYNGTDLDGDFLGDTEVPWKGVGNQIQNSGDDLPLYDTYVRSLECEFENSGIFADCTAANFSSNVTRIRANCTDINPIDGTATMNNATFNLTNLYDNINFVYGTTSTIIGGYYVLDHSDVQILDSGLWQLEGICTDTNDVSKNSFRRFDIPFGNLSNAVMLAPPGNYNAQNGTIFTAECTVQCTGGECVNTTVTLDPILPLTNLTQPTGAIHRVYADSQFIYGASEDQSTYVWNKTSLNLFATLNSTSAYRTVWADAQSIYTGDTNSQIKLWNRTDLTTPFANVANITFDLTPFSIRSNNKYIFAGLGAASGGAGRIEVYNKTSLAFVANLTNATDIVRSMDIDSNYLYAVDHGCNFWIYNLSDFSSTTLAVNPSCTQLKDVSVDNYYIYVHGQVSSNAFTQVWNKTNYALVFDWNDTTGNYYGAAVYSGGNDFGYHGGPLNGWWADGWIGEINKSSWTLGSTLNLTSQVIKTIFCDADYLYAGTLDPSASNNLVMLFNNPCFTTPPPDPITISAVSITPSSFPVTTNDVSCSANITTPGIIDNVSFTLTYPDGSVVSLSSTNISDIYTSQNFTINSTADHNCTVTANNTNGTAASATLTFHGGSKGMVPMNSGSPFYTTSQNPVNGSNQSCLNSLVPGQTCNSTWNVTTNGTIGQTWAFFCTYNGSENSLTTPRSNVTITLGGNQPNMTITKTDNPDPVHNGTNLNYTITYCNNGTANASLVFINDTYDANVSYISAAPSPDPGTNNTWTIGNVTPGNCSTINITVLVDPGIANNTNITNIANLSYQNASGDVFNASAVEITLALWPPAPTPTPTPSGGGGGGSATRRYTPLNQTPQAVQVSCLESWLCDGWGPCENGMQMRSCVDLKNCGTANLKPDESRNCTPVQQPVLETPAPVPEPVIEKPQEIVAPKIETEQRAGILSGIIPYLEKRNIIRAVALLVMVSALLYMIYYWSVKRATTSAEWEGKSDNYIKNQKKIAKQMLEGKIKI